MYSIIILRFPNVSGPKGERGDFGPVGAPGEKGDEGNHNYDQFIVNCINMFERKTRQ